MRNTVTGFALALAMGLSLTACKDTKTLQENEQLKAQVADLQKQDGQLGNTVETLTATRDALVKENESLKEQVASRKTKRPTTKASRASSRKRRRV
jgi:hypothetical protein